MRLVLSWPAMAALALASVLVWAAFLTAPDQDLHVSVIDVGEGDAILVRTASHQVLVDGGPSPQAITGYLGEVLPFWDRHIDMVVLTHPHDDHLMGLVEVVRRYDVGGVLASPYERESGLDQEWRSMVESRGIPYVVAKEGQEVLVGDQLRFQVLYPREGGIEGGASGANNNSVVLRVVFGSFSMVLAGDIERQGEDLLVATQADLSGLVLKVPHQGARTSLTPGFLARVSPRVAVISTGKGNQFGHPAPETLDKLKDVEVFRTDINGTIEIITDGRTYSVKVARQE